MNALVLSAVLAATPITLQQVREESRNNLQALLSELDRVDTVLDLTPRSVR